MKKGSKRTKVYAARSDRRDLTGMTFARLTVLGDAPNTTPRQRRVSALCECGTVKAVRVDKVWRGKTRSCGCLRAAMASDRLRRMWAIAKADGRPTAPALVIA